MAFAIHDNETSIPTILANCATKRSEEHTSELQSRENLVCRLLLEKKKKNHMSAPHIRPYRAPCVPRTSPLAVLRPSPPSLLLPARPSCSARSVGTSVRDEQTTVAP